MNSIWTTSTIVFAATIAIVVTLFVAFFPAMGKTGERLAKILRPFTKEEVRFRRRQQDRLERTMTGLGKLLPTTNREMTHTQRLMVRAGYRSQESFWIMRSFKLLIPAGLVILVWFTGAYTSNPFFVIGMALLVGFLLPEFWLTWRVRVRQRRILLGLPDALDLLVICVEAGLGLDQALTRVAQEIHIAHPDLSEELQLVNLEMRVGKSRSEALRELAVRTGVEDIKGLTAMLIQTDRFGTNLAQALRVHSENLRVRRRQRAEEIAARATVKMVPPLVFFIFPALFVVLLGPAVLILIRQVFPILGK